MAEVPKYVNIKDSTNLLRDTFSMGVLNTNRNAYEEAIKRHQFAMQKLSEERRKDHELNTLKREIDELKILVHRLLEK